MNIGICVIAYNRIISLKRVLSSVANGYYDEKVTLIISIDKSECKEVYKFADSFNWKHGEKRIIKHPVNLGLRTHVLKCGDLLNEFDALIVLEDDVSVAPSFYFYARQCVEKFYNDDNVAGISLYGFSYNYHNQMPFHPIQTDSDVYFMQCAQSWGEVWMKHSWFRFKEWYADNNSEFGYLPHLPHTICDWPQSSWLKYHTKYCIENNKYFVYPYVSLSTNNSDPGVHYKNRNTITHAFMLYGYKDKFNLNPQIKYDCFFESELIYDLLGISKNELCIDFYGEKCNRKKKRYWLTMSCLPYKIICSYDLSQRPYEWNIINNIKGNVIFLYDTKECGKTTNRGVHRIINIFKYLYGLYGLKNILKKQLHTMIQKKK